MVAAEPDPLGRHETEGERADRNFSDILQELRVTQTGVQVLFSLLLTVPFSQRFDQVTSFQRDVYFVALVLAAATASMLIAPVSIHRLLFRTGDKPWVVTVSSRCAVAGTVLLLMTFTAVLLLITDVLFTRRAADGVAAVFLALSALLWFLPPLLRRRRAAQTP